MHCAQRERRGAAGEFHRRPDQQQTAEHALSQRPPGTPPGTLRSSNLLTFVAKPMRDMQFASHRSHGMSQQELESPNQHLCVQDSGVLPSGSVVTALLIADLRSMPYRQFASSQTLK